MKFLICYSRIFSPVDNVRSGPDHVNTSEPPRAGSVIELESMEDLLSFQEYIGHSLIVHRPDWQPSFLYNYELMQETFEDFDIESYYLVEKLPKDYKTYRWLEVYNGYRE